MKQKNLSRKRLGWIALALIAIVAVAATIIVTRRSKVQYASPVRHSILEAIFGLGKVKSKRHYEVKLGVMATALDVYVVEGQTVKKGDPLVRFEAGVFRAPFPGTITEVNATSGETIVPQAPVLRVEDLSEQFVEVALEQQGALRVRPGMIARMTFDTIRGDQYKGKVTSVFSRSDEFLAHIGVEKFPPGVLPGMTADVVIEVGTKDNALLVPLASIQDGRVLIERGGRRNRVPVEVGIVDGQWAEVLKGELKEEDRIVMPKKSKAPEAPQQQER